MAQQPEAAPHAIAAQPEIDFNERRIGRDGQAYTFLQFLEYYGVTAGPVYWMLDGAEQSVVPSASFAEGSVAQPALTCELAMFIHYLPRRALAQGSIALVCRNWLQGHREHAWRFMVLAAPNLGNRVLDDMDMSAAHATVKAFSSAPLEVQQRAALSAKSLTLKIAQLEEFLDHYQKWIHLPFDSLVRLVIEGPTHAEHGRGLPLQGLDGLRLGFVLSKLSHTVETLILQVSLSDENEQHADHSTMAAIVSTFSRLKVLGMPEMRNRLLPGCKVSTSLECCQGLAVDINTFHLSWLGQVHRLERLHLSVSDHRHPAVFDCGPLLSFLADKCPQLYYLLIHFEGRALVSCGGFTCTPTSLKWLVLSFDDVDVLAEGLAVGPLRRPFWNPKEADAYEAECICDHLRPLVPASCKLGVLKGWFGGLWPIDIEDSCAACTHEACV